MTTKSKSAALKSIGGTRELQRQYRQYSQSVDYIDKDRRNLLKDYDNEWVAVYNSEVVGHSKKYGDVVKIIERKKLPLAQVALKRLSSRRRITLY